ncbi:ROK family transcriptional regulator [Actinocorallia longicatena]|uniref:ROK family transcriptional regulator n=1 Tax=Actinocorallia longicatena TaxID=111803 RepID=A0ABP6QRQ0_9ACTN
MPADSRTARRINDRAALDVIASAGRLSRTDLRERTGLTQPTVIDLVNRLLAAGLIEPAGPSDEIRPGRRPEQYAIATTTGRVAALHLTPDSLTAALGDVSGRTFPPVTVPHTEAPLTSQLDALIDLAFTTAALSRTPLTSAVLAVHDPTADDRDTRLTSTTAAARTALSCPVTLEHETTLTAIAEHHFGSARDQADFTLLWLGDDLSLAHLTHGTPLPGTPGDIGTLPLPRPTREEPAPLRSGFRETSFQDLASTTALQSLARTHSLTHPTLEANLKAAVSASFAAPIHPFLQETATRISLALHTITTLLTPTTIVLAGPTTTAATPLLPALAEHALSTRTTFRML